MTGIVILGAGRWGNHLIRIFSQHPAAKIVAIVDPDADRLQAIAEKFNFDPSVVLTTGWPAARNLPQVEAVAVTSPASTHYDIIADALKRGFHVLAEKPLTLDPASSLELCRLAEQQQRQLMVDHTYLFNPAIAKGREVVQSGTLGQCRYGYAARTHLGPIRTDVDALWDLAIHDISIFNCWLGAMPVKVRATGTTWLQDNAEDWELFPRGLADVVWLQLSYPGSVHVVVHLCWCNPDKQRRLALTGSDGTLIFDEMNADSPLTLCRGRAEPEGDRWLPVGGDRETVSYNPGEPLKEVCDRFLESVRSRQPVEVSSGWVGAQLVRVLAALSESMRQGGQAIALKSVTSF